MALRVKLLTGLAGLGNQGDEVEIDDRFAKQLCTDGPRAVPIGWTLLEQADAPPPAQPEAAVREDRETAMLPEHGGHSGPPASWGADAEEDTELAEAIESASGPGLEPEPSPRPEPPVPEPEPPAPKPKRRKKT